MNDSGNDNKGLITEEAETEVDSLKDKDLMLINEYLKCFSVREAGRRMGFAESTINSGYLYQKFGQPKFQAKLRNAYIARDYRDLAVVYALERDGLHEIAKQAKEKPESIIENLPKFKHIAKQKKMIANILGPEQARPTAPMVNIGNLFVGQSGAHPHSILFQEHHAVDAEIIEDDK